MKNGAPFPLINRSDVIATYRNSAVRLLMIEQLKARRMPLAPITITDPQRETLLSWLEAGAPAIAATSCPDGVTDAGTD